MNRSIFPLQLSCEDIKVHMEDNEANTALWYAIQKNYVAQAKLLLAHKEVDVNITNKKNKKLNDYDNIRKVTESTRLLLSH